MKFKMVRQHSICLRKSKKYERLKNNPEQFPYCLDENLKEKKYRKAVLLTMNYTVIFQIDQNNVHIIGIFHNLENYGEQL